VTETMDNKVSSSFHLRKTRIASSHVDFIFLNAAAHFGLGAAVHVAKVMGFEAQLEALNLTATDDFPKN